MPFELIAVGFFVAGILVGMAIMYAQGLMADANERHDRLMAVYDVEAEGRRRSCEDPVRTFAGGRMMTWNMNACLDCLKYASNGGLETCRTAAETSAQERAMSYTEQELNEVVDLLLAQYHANDHTFRRADA